MRMDRTRRYRTALEMNITRLGHWEDPKQDREIK